MGLQFWWKCPCFQSVWEGESVFGLRVGKTSQVVGVVLVIVVSVLFSCERWTGILFTRTGKPSWFDFE